MQPNDFQAILKWLHYVDVQSSVLHNDTASC